MAVEWTNGIVDLRCPVCGRTERQELVAMAGHAWHPDPIPIARCRDCSAIVLGGVLPPGHYDAPDVDRYVEQYASVEALAGSLVTAGARPSARVLDIGCGYGFALDVGQFLFGWRGVGLDPSVTARRGRVELGLDIRDGTLDDAFAPDERFDVVFASEVLEHVPDPRGFLGEVRARLAADGVLVLTTPDAEVVVPGTPVAQLHATLSLTAHEFLVDAAGLERLLASAGFAARVWRHDGGLRALAAMSSEVLATTDPDATVDIADVMRYLDDRADSSPEGSALALGMAARYLKTAVNTVRLDDAAASLPRVRRLLRARHGLDLEDPAATMALTEPPPVLAALHDFAGKIALLRDQDPERALAHFRASVDAVAKRYVLDNDCYADPETPAMEAAAHERIALMLAALAPGSADEGLVGLEGAIGRGAGSPDRLERCRAEVAAIERAARAPTRRARRLAGRLKRRLRSVVGAP